MQPTDLIRHDIASGNLLLGSMFFITLNLPPAWDLAPGVGRPEIIAGHERSGRKWVVSGRAWYVIFDPQRRWAMELALQASSLPRGKKEVGGEHMAETMVHGHPATVRRWHGRRGLFNRRTIAFLRVEFDCPVSDRHLTVELSGRCPPEAFDEILEAMPHWRCH